MSTSSPPTGRMVSINPSAPKNHRSGSTRSTSKSIGHLDGSSGNGAISPQDDMLNTASPAGNIVAYPGSTIIPFGSWKSRDDRTSLSHATQKSNIYPYTSIGSFVVHYSIR